MDIAKIIRKGTGQGRDSSHPMFFRLSSKKNCFTIVPQLHFFFGGTVCGFLSVDYAGRDFPASESRRVSKGNSTDLDACSLDYIDLVIVLPIQRE